MPESKKRQQHQHHQPPHKQSSKKNNRVVAVAVIFFALIGFGIAFFGAGSNIIWLLAGAIIGGICGYFFGHQIDNAISKR